MKGSIDYLVRHKAMYCTADLPREQFNSASTAVPAYETGWGGIINRAGYNDVWVDFGNGYYNDHHFHYGYILAAGAVIAKYLFLFLRQMVS